MNAEPGFKRFLGCVSVFGSAFFFYLATVVIKKSQASGLEITPSFFVFIRFLSGFACVVLVMKIQNQKIRIITPSLLIGRAVANLIAVYCFFKGVSLTSVAQSNILNMTYPLFIALFSWIFFKEQRDRIAVMIVGIAFAGVWLILAPESMQFNLNSIWGLASGIFAAIAIIYLNLSRKVHDSHTILFFLFGIGSIVIFLLFFKQMSMPGTIELKYLLLCAFFSIAGQYLITIGFKYVTAIEGGILSSSRIFLAAILGPYIAMDPSLSFRGWVGAFLIFSGNVYLTFRKNKIPVN